MQDRSVPLSARTRESTGEQVRSLSFMASPLPNLMGLCLILASHHSGLGLNTERLTEDVILVENPPLSLRLVGCAVVKP